MQAPVQDGVKQQQAPQQPQPVQQRQMRDSESRHEQARAQQQQDRSDGQRQNNGNQQRQERSNDPGQGSNTASQATAGNAGRGGGNDDGNRNGRNGGSRAANEGQASWGSSSAGTTTQTAKGAPSEISTDGNSRQSRSSGSSSTASPVTTVTTETSNNSATKTDEDDSRSSGRSNGGSWTAGSKSGSEDNAQGTTTGQTSSGQTIQKTGTPDRGGTSGGGDTSKSSSTQDRASSTSGSTDSVAATAVTQPVDSSFASSSSLADFFRRNTPAATPATVVTPAAVATPAVAVETEKSVATPKPVKTNAAAAPASTAATSAAATKVAAGGGVPVPDLPFQVKGSFKPREIIASDLGPAALQKARALGFAAPPQSLFGSLGLTSVQRLIVPAGMSEAEAYKLLSQQVPSGRFGPNYVYRITPADGAAEKPAKSTDTIALAPGAGLAPCSGEKCFGQSLIGWKPENRTCARPAKIGIIDTSFDLSHPAFAGHSFLNGNFLGDGVSSPHDWHGTAVLSLLAGDARGGTPGLVPDAQFLLASAFSTDSDGNASADTMGVLNALSWLETFGVQIVNMSFSGPHDELIEKAISAMSRKGVVFVAAAGNRGPDAPPSYPAAYADVIAVTAVGRTLQNYRHANRGGYVDAAAPGVDVWTALPNGREGFRTGTSFAAPFFTGVLAAMPSVRSGTLSKAQILATLKYKDLGPPGRDPIFGEGIVQAPATCAAEPQMARRQETSPPKMGVGADQIKPAKVQVLPAQAASGPGAQ